MSTPYPKDPISPLRARMIEDLCVRSFSLATQRGYIRGVKMLAAFLKRSPDTATAEEVRAFQRHHAGRAEHDSVGAAVLLPVHCRQAGDDTPSRLQPRAAEASARAVGRGHRPPARGGT